MGRLARVVAQIFSHPYLGPVARVAVRQATAALVRHVRTKTRQKNWGKIS